MGETLPHEAGHMISGNMALVANILDLDSTSMEVASRSVIAEELPGAIFYNVEFVKTLNDEDLSLIKEVLALQRFFGIPEDREQFIRWYEQFLTSPAMRALKSFNNSVELFQILGVFTAFHLDSSKNISNVLYINLLSDAAYYIREGLPLRYSHALITNSNEEIVRLRCMEHLKLTHESCLNPNFYGALIKAYGFDPLEYEDQLLSYSALGSCWISPYTSLIPALKKMYEMNREDFWTRFLSLPPVSFDGEFSRHRKELRDAAIRIVNLLEFAFRIATSFRFSQ
jgi:hypothetical protein